MCEGTEGQDRKSYTDDQDRESYTVNNEPPETDGATYVRCARCEEYVVEGEWAAHDCEPDYREERARLVSAANERIINHHSIDVDDLEVDDNARLSHGDDGVWVQCWLWIPNEDDEDEDD